ncbi:hypothetical protein NMG60_11019101 [Bertholletia excelsa]
MMEFSDFIDLGPSENLFTWFCIEQGTCLMLKCLERALADDNWHHSFPEAFVENFRWLPSDHAPILFRCEGLPVRVKERPFRFPVAWTMDGKCFKGVATAWQNGNQIGLDSLLKACQDSLVFNKQVCGNIFL